MADSADATPGLSGGAGQARRRQASFTSQHTVATTGKQCVSARSLSSDNARLRNIWYGSAALSSRGSEKPPTNNTYRTEPRECERFEVTKELQDDYYRILKGYLGDRHYSPSEAPHLAKTISDTIKNKSKMSPCPRYKIVVTVTLGECTRGSVQQASRCLWDAQTDSCCSVTYNNGSLFASAAVYAIYMS